MGLSGLFTASLLALQLLAGPAAAAPSNIHASKLHTAVEPFEQPRSLDARADSTWWFANIERNGVSAFNKNPDSYKVFRNVKDYGAAGDGSTDDTDAINKAIADGERCGEGCESSTTQPGLIYFPPGTYIVSKPIIMLYYSQLVGDKNSLPVLKASADFTGMAVLDADPYDDEGNNWWTNQNNFFRQVRNFEIDLTGMPKSAGAGIHWQTAQATSLHNIVFRMVEDKSPDNKQSGIFMDNGVGGYMTDLTFIGGNYGMFVGNQQYTTRNLTFSGCNTAVFVNWNWLWNFHGINIDNCGVGIDMSAGGDGIQTVGSVLLIDSTISNTDVGILTVYTPEQTFTNGTLIIDNTDMSSVPIAVKNNGTQSTILEGNTKIDSWIQGRAYIGGKDGEAVQDAQTPFEKPKILLNDEGKFIAKSKPQYDNVDASKFVSVKAKGAKGDGSTDDTKAIQDVFDNIKEDEIVYFDHGSYIITDTVKVPKNIKIVGEIWPRIMAGGDKNFQDQANPKVMWQIGEKGDVGNVEMQDLMFEIQGPQPGAILMEWNVEGETPGSAGLFDVHWRIGGTAGSKLQKEQCLKSPKKDTKPVPECMGAFMMLHVTSEASILMDHAWLWVSDHELDTPGQDQINIYSGRGVLFEGTHKGVWMYGTGSEHSVLQNYQFNDASNIYMSVIQTETAYFQGNPDALVPFDVNEKYYDPDFSKSCTGDSDKCARTWGIRVVDSKDVLLHGGGLYSFFNNYDQVCVGENNCQDNIISIENSDVALYGVTTKASINMFTVDGQSAALDADNRNVFGAAVALFSTSGSTGGSKSGDDSNSGNGDENKKQPEKSTSAAPSTPAATQPADSPVETPETPEAPVETPVAGEPAGEGEETEGDGQPAGDEDLTSVFVTKEPQATAAGVDTVTVTSTVTATSTVYAA